MKGITMTMSDTTKLHIVYGAIIVALTLGVVHYFNKPPEQLIKTLTKVVTQVQTVEKVVTKDRIVYVDRKIVTKKKNGDVITETEHEHSATATQAATDTQTQTKSVTQEEMMTQFYKKYSIDYSYKPIYNGSLDLHPNLQNSVLGFGYRVGDSPISVITSISDGGKSISTGVRVDFN
jgi:CRISPR/Cas system endoribonuclease Cas6 (RAMP superfamily)